MISTTIKLALIAGLLGVIVFQSQSCSHTKTDNEVREIFSVNSKADLLFFFKKDSSRESRDSFYQTVLNKPLGDGTYWPRDGVETTFAIERSGYQGFAIKLQDGATAELRKDLRRVLTESGLVYKVYENLAPEDINDL